MQVSKLTFMRVREIAHYDPDTGIFTWRLSNSNRVKVGAEMGVLRKDGYLRVQLDGEKHYLHRLAWLYVYGHFPPIYIDHINGVRNDNRLCNLRLADYSLNSENQRKAKSDNQVGILGIERVAGSKRNPWSARIRVKGKRLYLGVFPTSEEAYEAYVTAKRRLHAGCSI